MSSTPATKAESDAGRGRSLAAASALLLSTGGAAIKISALGAAQIAAGRSLVAALAVGLLFPAARRGLTRGIAVSALCYAGTTILFIFANKLTTAGHTIFLQNVAPVWVVLAAPFFLSERASRGELLSLILSLAGCALIFLEPGEAGATRGNVLALVASLTYAGLLISYRRLSTEDGLAASIWGNVLVVVVIGPLAIDGGAPPARELLVLLYLGAVQQALAIFLYVRAARRITAVEGALILYLEPLLTPVWAWLLVRERFPPLAWAGGGLVIAGALVRSWLASRAPPVDPRRGSGRRSAPR